MAGLAFITATGAIQLLFIVLLLPLWWPIARAFWQDAQDTLREEGGLLGDTPNAKELERIRQEYGVYRSPLTSEPKEAYLREVAARRGRGEGRR